MGIAWSSMESESKKASAAPKPLSTCEMAAHHARLVNTAPENWARMISDWRSEAAGDALWLMYAASYLARTGGVRWAVDPVRLRNRVPDAPDVDTDAFSALSFVALTHDHQDHVDIALYRDMASWDITWLIPDHTRRVAEEAGIPEQRILVPRHFEPLERDGIRITPFPGAHEKRPAAGGAPAATTPATGYRVEWNGKSILFPGDVRTYDPASFRWLRGADTVCAHLWLGQGAALRENPPLKDEFCNFVEELRPVRRVLLTHLYELTRPPTDCWTEKHARRIQNRLAPRLAPVHVEIPAWFQAVAL